MDGYPASFMVTMAESNKVQVRIPQQLSPYMKGLRTPATVRRKNTYREWDVTLRQFLNLDKSTGVKFGDGWERCRNENEAKDGDDMVFEYSGNSVFTITILAAEDGRPKQIAAGIVPPLALPDRGKLPYAKTLGESGVLANCFIGRSKFPNFKVMLTPSYMRTGILNVPFNFACLYFPDEEEIHAIAKVRGGKWDISVSMYYKNRGRPYNCKISKGFRAVIEGARLRTSQILVFELVKDADPMKLRVTPFGPDEER